MKFVNVKLADVYPRVRVRRKWKSQSTFRRTGAERESELAVMVIQISNTKTHSYEKTARRKLSCALAPLVVRDGQQAYAQLKLRSSHSGGCAILCLTFTWHFLSLSSITSIYVSFFITHFHSYTFFSTVIAQTQLFMNACLCACASEN